MIQPVSNFLLLEVEEKEGIIIPDAGSEVQSGKVTAVGEGMYSDQGVLIPMQTKIGEIVWFEKFANAGRTIQHKNKEFALVRETDLIAKEGK